MESHHKFNEHARVASVVERLRGVEAAKIKCAEIFFKNLSAQGYNVHFRTQLNNKKMLQIVKEIINH